jgi:hypothetical protein
MCSDPLPLVEVVLMVGVHHRNIWGRNWLAPLLTCKRPERRGQELTMRRRSVIEPCQTR